MLYLLLVLLWNSSYIVFVLSMHRMRRRKLLPLVYSIKWMLKAKTEACCQVRISSALAVDPEFILPSLLIINRLSEQTLWKPDCPWGCCISRGREGFVWCCFGCAPHMFPICSPYVSHTFPICFPYVPHMFRRANLNAKMTTYGPRE